MREQLLHQPPMLISIPTTIKHTNPSTAPQTIPGHLQLVHSVDVLYLTFDGWTVGRAGKPKVEIFVATGFEVERVGA